MTGNSCFWPCYQIHPPRPDFPASCLCFRDLLTVSAIRIIAMTGRPSITFCMSSSCDICWSRTNISMHPKHVDSQDSRCIMTAFIYIMTGEDKNLLLARDPYIMLRLVPLATNVETQDLLPEVIRLTIVYGWAMLTDLDDEDEIEIFIQCFVGCLQSLIRPPHNRPYTLTPMTQA
ncbi:unnamed protein product [Rhizoctonia solani]|uniref:Uncharacterized protein n=1 Tax=Rhizoctonia solani TaxID=456999 RepID=A0A8H2WXD6_9AGAM|nr:unnamed protein product [Rhizoctonia solani]